ncbi:AzlC family ABC transporter permease [Kibdelosporangium lantanae]
MIRSIWRTLGTDLARDIALVCLADTVVGLSFGAIAVGAGLPLWLPMLLSVVVFAGAAQFLFVAVVAAGGNPVTAVLTGLLVNTRLVPMGFAVAEVLGKGPKRLLASHLLMDENVAFTVAQEDPRRRRATYWACGIGLFVCWNIGVVLGAFGGSFLPDPDAFGLDAAFPAVILALVMPSLKDRATQRAALAGVVIALATAPFLAPGIPVLLALVGVVASLGGDKVAAK